MSLVFSAIAALLLVLTASFANAGAAKPAASRPPRICV